LRLAREDLERLEGRLSERHVVQVQLGAEARAGRRLADGARDPAAAEVLESVEESTPNEL
jgi:hypothetical protein